MRSPRARLLLRDWTESYWGAGMGKLVEVDGGTSSGCVRRELYWES